MIRTAIADDQPLARAGLRAMLDQADDLAVVGEAADGRRAVELARSVVPDVMLMDVRMPVMDGIEATRRITSDPATRDVKVVILTTFDLDESVYAALRAGASGFLLKDVPPEELFAAIRVVASGDALIAPGVTRRLIAAFARSAYVLTTGTGSGKSLACMVSIVDPRALREGAGGARSDVPTAAARSRIRMRRAVRAGYDRVGTSRAAPGTWAEGP